MMNMSTERTSFDKAGMKYMEYPCYKTVCSYDFKRYNESYMKIPSDYVERLKEEKEIDIE